MRTHRVLMWTALAGGLLLSSFGFGDCGWVGIAAAGAGALVLLNNLRHTQ